MKQKIGRNMKTKFDIEKSEVIFKQNGVIGRRILKQENLEYLHLTFGLNCETQAHIQDNGMTFYVIKGEAKVIIDAAEDTVSQGQLLVIPAGSNRQWINIGNEDLELFVVKCISEK